MGLKQTRGSGCGLLEKGDLGSGSRFHVEAKSCRGDKMRIDSDWYLKATAQAHQRRKKVVLLQVAFMHRLDPAIQHLRWVGMAEDDFLKLGLPAPACQTAKKTFELKQSNDVGDCFSVLFAAANIKLFFVPEVFLTPTKIGNLHDL